MPRWWLLLALSFMPQRPYEMCPVSHWWRRLRFERSLAEGNEVEYPLSFRSCADLGWFHGFAHQAQEHVLLVSRRTTWMVLLYIIMLHQSLANTKSLSTKGKTHSTGGCQLQQAPMMPTCRQYWVPLLMEQGSNCWFLKFLPTRGTLPEQLLSHQKRIVHQVQSSDCEIQEWTWVNYLCDGGQNRVEGDKIRSKR